MFRLRRVLNTRQKLILNTIFLVGLTSVLFVRPFDGHFRFTFGVVVLSTLLLYFHRLPIITTAVLSGLVIMATRIVIYILPEASNYDLFTAALMSMPAVFFYIFFGLGFRTLRVRASIRNIPLTVLKISFIDFSSNILEIVLRHTFSISESVGFLPHLVGVAFFRSLLAVYGYYGLKRYRAFVLAEEHLRRYTQLIMVFAQIKTEMYYLQKSSQDIEAVMERSFLLYQQLDSGQAEMPREEAAGEALKIARDIHEVKKDYYRVMTGMEDMVAPVVRESGMALGEIFYMLEQNTARFLNSQDKKIDIAYSFTDDIKTHRHFAVISILNNLIINAIDACGQQGQIRVSQSRSDFDLVFSVEDNGCGIEEQDFAAIFSPGFSTKHSATTGKVSTGLGLVHVKNLAAMLGGTVKITSQVGKGTVFSVILPLGNIQEG